MVLLLEAFNVLALSGSRSFLLVGVGSNKLNPNTLASGSMSFSTVLKVGWRRGIVAVFNLPVWR